MSNKEEEELKQMFEFTSLQVLQQVLLWIGTESSNLCVELKDMKKKKAVFKNLFFFPLKTPIFASLKYL